ncbi:hypothetical protein [Nocardia asteroides]|uniref:hypothetical protein n=1 Tax=Nocardia asteroides TaxID=1824 RepID=UPI00342EF6C0
MYSTPTPAILGAALYRVYADSSQAPDSLELWIDIADTAMNELQMPVAAALIPWVPIALHYRKVTTDGEFFPHTGAVRIMTGPLTGTLYSDLDTATREVVAAIMDHLPTRDGGDSTNDNGDGDGGGRDAEDLGGDAQTDAEYKVYKVLPSWRFRRNGDSAAPTLRAAPPLIS